MEELLEDYKRRLTTIIQMIEDDKMGMNLLRLETKKGCYQTFIAELQREINKNNNDGR